MYGKTKGSKGHLVEEAETEASSHREATSSAVSSLVRSSRGAPAYSSYYTAHAVTNSSNLARLLGELGQNAYTSTEPVTDEPVLEVIRGNPDNLSSAGSNQLARQKSQLYL